MAECSLRSRLWGAPRSTGLDVTAGPVPLTTSHGYTHWMGMKCVQANSCPCWAANFPCTSGCPSENFCNQGPTRAPTAPRRTTNVRENIEEDQESALTLYHVIPPVVLHQDAPEFWPSVLPRGDEWPALLAHANTAHTAPSITETATPDPDTPAAVGSGKRNSNRAQPTDVQTVSPSPPSDQDSDVMLAAIIGESDSDSDYVESAENSPTSPSNKPDLEGHISDLEEMYEVAEGKIV